MYNILIYFGFLLCFAVNAESITYLDKTERELHEEAEEFFDRGNYRDAIKLCKRIDDMYPLSYWAMQAKLLSGISSYNIAKYDDVVNIMEEYIYAYPNSDDLPYVYYVRILAYYNQIKKIQLGQDIAYKTLELIEEYINLFPDDEYTNDMREKKNVVREHVLLKEYSIGMFYFRRGEYLAAIKRFHKIIDEGESGQFLSAVGNLVSSYLALGMEFEAQQYQDMLSNISYS